MSRRRSHIRSKLKKAIQSWLESRSPHVPEFTGDMTIDAAWNAHTGAPSVFARYHLPGCDGCAVRFDERLSEAAEAYGIDIVQFLADLNGLRR